MNVENAVSKAPKGRRSELSHVAKQQHDVDVVESCVADRLVAQRLVLIRGSSDPDAGDATRTSEFQHCGIAVVADDKCWFSRQMALSARLHDALNVCPAV